MLQKFSSISLALALFAQVPLTAAERTAALRCQDVVLNDNGTLTTRVVDLQGQPVAGQTVTILYQGREIASTISDSDGVAAVSRLRPGMHTVTTPLGATVCRFWNSDNAPPAAVAMPAIVSDAEIVRGQFGAFNLPMLVYAGVAAAALVVAIDAEGDADDLEDANQRLQSRVEALEAASP